MQQLTARTKASEMGVFAAIAAGVSLLIAQPLPALVPALVDLWLWQAPRVSPAGVAGPLGEALRRSPGADPSLADAIMAWGQSGDVAAIVGWFVPSLLAGLDMVPLRGLPERAVIDPGAGGSILLAIVMVILAAFGVMAYKTMLARVVVGRRAVDRAYPSEALRNGARYLGFLAMAAGAILAVVVPVAAAAAVAGVIGANLIPIVGLLLSIAAVAATVLLAFVGETIALTGAGPWQAVKISAGIVRADTGRTVGLLLVLWVALVTLPEVLAPLGSNALGIALAIAIYAFVATGLAMGRMCFVHERLPVAGGPARVRTPISP